VATPAAAPPAVVPTARGAKVTRPDSEVAGRTGTGAVERGLDAVSCAACFGATGALFSRITASF